MTTDIDPAFADRCAAAATSLRQLAELGSRPETDEAAVDRAAALTAELLADPEALLAVALVVEQRRAGMATAHSTMPSAFDPAGVPAPGWYWARCVSRGTAGTVGPWVVVEVIDSNGGRYVEITGSDEGAPPVATWGPRLEPPR